MQEIEDEVSFSKLSLCQSELKLKRCWRVQFQSVALRGVKARNNITNRAILFSSLSKAAGVHCRTAIYWFLFEQCKTLEKNIT